MRIILLLQSIMRIRNAFLIIWCLLGIPLLIVAINDFLFFRIEDEIILSIFGLYIISCIFGVSGHNFLQGFFAAVLIFIITFILNRRDLIGGGDVKLLFPLILFAEENLYVFLISASIAGAVLSIFYILFSRHILAFRKKIISKLRKFEKKNRRNAFLNIVLLSSSRIADETASLTYCAKSIWRQEIPYGVALSYGEFCVILENLLSG